MMVEPWHWLIIGTILVIFEIFTGGFYLFWFGVAALTVALLSWLFPISLAIQILVWLFVTVGLTITWFQVFAPMMTRYQRNQYDPNLVLGEVGLIIRPPSATQLGLIRFSTSVLGQDEWQCLLPTHLSQSDFSLQAGDRAKIVEVLGNRLTIAPLGIEHHHAPVSPPSVS